MQHATLPIGSKSCMFSMYICTPVYIQTVCLYKLNLHLYIYKQFAYINSIYTPLYIQSLLLSIY